jgi:tRNA-Thr(GGU) m(6)t(6)A37 methyltransferase TsaA
LNIAMHEILTVKPIGYIRTPFLDRADAPRQPGVGERVSGRITLNSGENFEQALEDLQGMEKIWLIYWFDRNDNWKPKTLTPRGGNTKRGLFATRSPYRPNPIGLSVVSLLSVKGLTLEVADVDLLDGTPILDIKPYLPFIESFPNAQTGWLNEIQSADEIGARFEVRWSAIATKQADWLSKHHAIELTERSESVLSLDPSPHPYRRTELLASGNHQLAIRSWRVIYQIDDRFVTILKLESGYSAAALEDDSTKIHDEPAHRGFHDLWLIG